MRRIDASRRKARAFWLRFSRSLANLWQLLSQAMLRSTRLRFVNTTKRWSSDRLTIFTFALAHRVGKLRSLVPTVCVELDQERVQAEQRRHQHHAAVAIWIRPSGRSHAASSFGCRPLHRTPTAAALARWDQRPDQSPLAVGQVTRRAQAATVMRASVLVSPHSIPPPDRQRSKRIETDRSESTTYRTDTEGNVDKVAFAVECKVTMDLGRCCPGWDHRDRTPVGIGAAERFCLISLVAEDVLGRQRMASTNSRLLLPIRRDRLPCQADAARSAPTSDPSSSAGATTPDAPRKAT